MIPPCSPAQLQSRAKKEAKPYDFGGTISGADWIVV